MLDTGSDFDRVRGGPSRPLESSAASLTGPGAASGKLDSFSSKYAQQYLANQKVLAQHLKPQVRARCGWCGAGVVCWACGCGRRRGRGRAARGRLLPAQAARRCRASGP